MQIILEENEIMDALNAYCAKQIKVPEGKRIKVDFTVGRGANATRATIEFEDNIQASTTEAGTVTTPVPTLEKKTKKPEEVNEIIENAAKEKPVSPVKKDPEPPVNPMATQQEKKESASTEEPDGSAETSSVKTDSLFNF